jgi:aldehyde:ferredoxin oxidoreductase
MSKILRVNMNERTATYEDVPDGYKLLGGRGLTSTMIHDEVDATCHPLGPNNKLVFAPGIVTGTAAPSSGRISVGAKSPLTGGIKESNAGSSWPQHVARLGLKAVVVEGQADGWWGVHITKDGAEFFAADEYAGKSLYEIFPRLFDRFGKKVGIATIGVAGEHKMAMAGICFNDIDNRPSRYSGRGGLGAVMGSKGLKLIVVDGAGGPGVEIANKELFDRCAATTSPSLVVPLTPTAPPCWSTSSTRPAVFPPATSARAALRARPRSLARPWPSSARRGAVSAQWDTPAIPDVS